MPVAIPVGICALQAPRRRAAPATAAGRIRAMKILRQLGTYIGVLVLWLAARRAGA